MALLAGSALALLWAPAALAQTASQVTPPTFEPQLQKPGTGVVIPEGAGATAPPGSEGLEVQLAGIQIEGGLSGFEAQASAVKSELVGKTVSVAQVFDAARTLEKAYAAGGYPLVRVIVPAQRLVDGGTARIVVVDGFLERIDTSKLPKPIRKRVAALLEPLVGQRGLTRAAIERKLLIAGDLPGSVLRSTLSPGQQAGGGVLTIEARYKPVTGFASIDNSLSAPLGKENIALGLDLNSVLGLGELVYVRLSGAPADGHEGLLADQPRSRTAAAGLVLPLGDDGLALNLEATASRTAPETSRTSLAFISDFSRFSARLSYPAIRARDLTVNLNAALDAQDEILNLLLGSTYPLSKDRLRVLRAGADGVWYAPAGGQLTASATVSAGLNGLGARGLSEALASGTPLSRQGAEPDFRKLELNLAWRQPVGQHLAIDLRGKAQTSFRQPLLNSEQIGLVTPTGLSTFALGSMQGDGGYVVRAEAQAPYVVPLTLPFGVGSFPAQQGSGLAEPGKAAGALLISPYLFGAYGGVSLRAPTALEPGYQQGAAYGVGLRASAAQRSSFNGLNVGVEYGRAQHFGGGTDPDENRFTFTAAIQF